MAAALDDLGGKVLGRPTQGPRPIQHFLGETEVRHLDVPLVIQQQVLGLEVAVQNVLGVHVLQHRQHRGSEVARCGQRETSRRAQVAEELPSRSKLHEHVQVGSVLERRVQAHGEGVLELSEDGALRHHVLHLLEPDDLVLSHNLHRHVRPRRLVPHQPHVPKPARAQQVHGLELVAVGELLVQGLHLEGRGVLGGGFPQPQLGEYPAPQGAQGALRFALRRRGGARPGGGAV
mmetsp:Transcript_43848/g.83733  ORF Transcript_43848/g.83733 Transcript_43848/m.83733 type:complete len:233 (+) Transcript_43848:975-1673(+)